VVKKTKKTESKIRTTYHIKQNTDTEEDLPISLDILLGKNMTDLCIFTHFHKDCVFSCEHFMSFQNNDAVNVKILQ